MNVLFAILGRESCRQLDAVVSGLRGLREAFDLEPVLLRFRPEDADGCRPESLADVELVELVCGNAPEYGDAVKLAFDYAVQTGQEAVVILDGEMRYPVAAVREMLNALSRGGADMVLGIPARPPAAHLDTRPRFLVQPGALFTSQLLNVLLRARLSGWHCGFRAYRIGALVGLPYRYNASGRMFNTDIIIQFLLKGLSIVEVPAPGYRHRDMRFFDKARFALDMLRACSLSLLHRMSIFYQRRFDLVETTGVYQLKLGYASSHTAALRLVPDGSRVLDIGCGDGSLADLLRRRGCDVHGIDQHDMPDCPKLDDYTRMDLDVRDHRFGLSDRDIVLLLDVLEHLRQPELLLEHIRFQAAGRSKPLVIISVPNVAFFIIRLRLLFGSFHYGKLGILDLTHARLFTEGSIKALLDSSGFDIESLEGVPAPYPKAIGLGRTSRLLLAVNRWLIRVNRRFFSYQLLLTARPKPVLADFKPGSRPAA